MISVRRQTFETNSSSTHSITVIDDTLVKSELYEDPCLCYDSAWEGSENCWCDCIAIDLCGFCGWDDHESQEERLALVALQIIHNLGYYPHCTSRKEWNEMMAEVYESEQWKELEEEICNYTGAKHLRLNQYTEGYIDHDSVYDSWKDLLDYNGFSCVVDYVFACSVKTHFEFCG